jgi:cytochrome o ubiquinol oxidase subunit IV
MTVQSDDHTALDVAPGAMDAERESVSEGVQSYLIGLALAALLTAAAFYFAQSQWIWGPSIPIALSVLAVAQIGVHLVFFLHLTTAPDNVNNTLALAFGTLIVGLVIGGTLWIMYHMNMNMPPMERMPTPVASVARSRTATGVIEAAKAEPVAAKVSGVIRSVGCDVGMRVQKGQLCAMIDAPSLDRAVAQSEGTLRAAQARVKHDQAALAAAQARLRPGPGARKRVEALQEALGRDERAAAATQQALDAAKARLADAKIVAPADGVVLSRNVKPGQAVAPNSEQPLFLFAPDATTVEFRASLPESLATALKAGEKVVFTVDQLQGESFEGEILRVAPAQGAAAAEVVVVAPNPRAALKPGTKATIRAPAPGEM